MPETADLALAGRDVPRLVLADLNDIRFGEFEGRPLTEYRAWAHAHGPEDVVPGGDSRAQTVARYVRAYRTILARPEETVLVVAHGLPVRYVLDALEGRNPAAAVAQVPYAEPFRLERAGTRGGRSPPRVLGQRARRGLLELKSAYGVVPSLSRMYNRRQVPLHERSVAQLNWKSPPVIFKPESPIGTSPAVVVAPELGHVIPVDQIACTASRFA